LELIDQLINSYAIFLSKCVPPLMSVHVRYAHAMQIKAIDCARNKEHDYLEKCTACTT